MKWVKLAAVAVFAAISVAGVLAGGFWIHSERVRLSEEAAAIADQRKHDLLAGKVAITVVYDETKCPKSHLMTGDTPVEATILNGSDASLLYTVFSIDARHPNYSNSEYLGAPPRRQTYRIIPSGERWTECFLIATPFGPLDQDLTKLVWTAFDPAFEFEDTATMPPS